MSLFKSRKKSAATAEAGANGSVATALLAELALNTINDGVIIVDGAGVVKFANPAAATMTGYNSAENLIGLDYKLIVKLENIEGAPVPEGQDKLSGALRHNQPMTTREYLLVAAQSAHKTPVALTMVPAGGLNGDRIITFRDIAKELEEAGAQTEFISTASHEMRTPVASIEGYLGLALNPQTTTIDNRARQYLEAAHSASQHLGRLFKDLLDVTKLDDGRMRVELVPVEIVGVVKEMADAHSKEMLKKHLKYSFGTAGAVNKEHSVEPKVYAAVDLDFLREILDNLLENAIKYTPDGGEIWVNARGDGDKVLINVTDTGIGVAADDLTHIFQKFYRVDNSQTRQIGGTGLGLYLVKQRVEALGGRVWCESAFGDGSTFFVSLPRLSDAEYAKQRLAYENSQAVKAFASGSAPVSHSAEVTQITQSTAVAPEQTPVAVPQSETAVVAPATETKTAAAQAAVPTVAPPAQAAPQNMPQATSLPTQLVQEVTPQIVQPTPNITQVPNQNVIIETNKESV